MATSSTDLADRIRLGMHHLCVNFDEQQGQLPWFDVRLREGRPGYLEHYECFDTAHVPGRCLDALLLGEHVTGRPAPASAIDIFRGFHLQSFKGSDGLNGYTDHETGRRTILFHNLREGLLGLNALIEFRNDGEAADAAKRMVETIESLVDSTGAWREEALRALAVNAAFPWSERGPDIGTAPQVIGRLVGPLVDYSRIVDDAAAFELAVRLARRTVDVAFAPDGSLTEAAGSHLHSITSTISGLCQLSRLLDDPDFKARVESIFSTAVAPWASGSGWIKELVACN